VKRLRRWFLTGLAVVLPTVVTAWLLWKIFSTVDRVLDPLVERWLGFRIPGLGFVAMLVILTLAGLVTSNILGRQLLQAFEGIVHRLPIAGRIYVSVKQIMDVFVTQKPDAFQSVVLFQYPRRGLWALGLISRQTPPELHSHEDEPFYNVFVPTSPNPTSGFVLFVPESELRHSALSVEEALKLIISGGAYVPLPSAPGEAPEPLAPEV
jgi:uncharacterized membrane protein